MLLRYLRLNVNDVVAAASAQGLCRLMHRDGHSPFILTRRFSTRETMRRDWRDALSECEYRACLWPQTSSSCFMQNSKTGFLLGSPPH